MAWIAEMTPSWISWVIAAIAIGVSIWVSIWKSNLAKEQARKVRLETNEIEMRLLSDGEAAAQKLLDAALLALNARGEAGDSAGGLDGIALDSMGGPGITEHVLAYRKARADLPAALDSLRSFRARRVEIEKDLVRRTPLNKDALNELREQLDQITESVLDLIATVMDAPRIFIGDSEPEDSKDGDLWFHAGPG